MGGQSSSNSGGFPFSHTPAAAVAMGHSLAVVVFRLFSGSEGGHGGKTAEAGCNPFDTYATTTAAAGHSLVVAVDRMSGREVVEAGAFHFHTLPPLSPLH